LRQRVGPDLALELRGLLNDLSAVPDGAALRRPLRRQQRNYTLAKTKMLEPTGPRSPDASLRLTRRGRLARAAQFSEVPRDTGMLAAGRWSFDGVIQRVLGFSRAAEIEGARKGARLAPRAPSASKDELGSGGSALDALRHFVRSLDQETQSKLRAMIRAGRDAQQLQVAAATLAGETAGQSDPLDWFAAGSAALQDLQRGHALACATGFNLELSLARWDKVRPAESLDERVWLRFGRELAQSRMEDWSCFALVDSRERLLTLYLRRGKALCWSFAAQIDRPSDRTLRGPRSTRTGGTHVVVLTPQAALGRPCAGNLLAVRRASMAVSARLGRCRVSVRRAAPARRA
jgi:hypothetical protein